MWFRMVATCRYPCCIYFPWLKTALRTEYSKPAVVFKAKHQPDSNPSHLFLILYMTEMSLLLYLQNCSFLLKIPHSLLFIGDLIALELNFLCNWTRSSILSRSFLSPADLTRCSFCTSEGVTVCLGMVTIPQGNKNGKRTLTYLSKFVVIVCREYQMTFWHC